MPYGGEKKEIEQCVEHTKTRRRQKWRRQRATEWAKATESKLCTLQCPWSGKCIAGPQKGEAVIQGNNGTIKEFSFSAKRFPQFPNISSKISPFFFDIIFSIILFSIHSIPSLILVSMPFSPMPM
jgi:hypothetical protein